jgi:hypothetical protein
MTALGPAYRIMSGSTGSLCRPACRQRRPGSKPLRCPPAQLPRPIGAFSIVTITTGKTLWSRGRLTGVVDWNQASWGPASVDLGHMRWNLALPYGIQAAEEFLALYGTLTAGAVQHHPYWDAVTVSDLVGGIDLPTLCPAAILRSRKPYVAAALMQL